VPTSIARQQAPDWLATAHGEHARHWTYRLTCEHFNDLLIRSGNKCGVCGTPGYAWRCLHIDHDHSVGQWAVRGLLCEPHNHLVRIDRLAPGSPQVQAYLQNPWWKQALEAAGLRTEVPAEPENGSFVLIADVLWMRIDEDRPGGMNWHQPNPRSPRQASCATWSRLWYDYGPLNISTDPAAIKSASFRRPRIANEYVDEALALLRDHQRQPDPRVADEVLAILTRAVNQSIRGF